MNISNVIMKHFLGEAYKIARRSPDPSSQNGAALIYDTVAPAKIILGFNHFYPGVPPEVGDRNVKLNRIVHAEHDAILKMARGGSTEGSILFSPWACCRACAIAIIGAGVGTVVVHKPRMDLPSARWQTEITESKQWLHEAGITVIEYSGKVSSLPILVSGRLWNPTTLNWVTE
jgi:deoxycytidylate deaminase